MSTDRVKALIAEIARLSDYEQACLISDMIDPAQGCPSMFHGDDWLCDVLFEARDVADKLVQMTDPDNADGVDAWADRSDDDYDIGRADAEWREAAE